MFKISLIALVAIIAVAFLISGIAYINSDENKIKSRIGKTYNFESYYGSVDVNGSAKIISGDKLSLKIMITADEENVINTKVDSTIIFKLRDEENFALGEFRVSDFTRVNYNSDTQTVSGYEYDDIINISYDLRRPLIKAAEISPNSYIGFKTISHSELQKNKEEKEAAQREAAQRFAQREAAKREAAKREAAKREVAKRLAAYKKNWRALQKGMSPLSVKNLLGSPDHITSGFFPIHTYSETVNNRRYRGTVTFYEGVVWAWDEPSF